MTPIPPALPNKRMRSFHLAVLAVLLPAVGAAPVPAAPARIQQASHVKVKAIPETVGYVPGRPLRVAFVMDIAPGWHTYWLNPGTAGEPARIEWTLPEGWASLGLEFPVPSRLEEEGLTVFGYRKRTVLMNTLVPSLARSGRPVTLTARLTWLVCKDVCLGEEKRIRLVLEAAGTDLSTPNSPSLFVEWVPRIPTLSPGVKPYVRKNWFIPGWRLFVPANIEPGDAQFYPLNRQGIDLTVPIRARKEVGRWVFDLKPDPDNRMKDGALRGVIAPGPWGGPVFISVPLP